jgi:hypothetical protein
LIAGVGGRIGDLQQPAGECVIAQHHGREPRQRRLVVVRGQVVDVRQGAGDGGELAAPLDALQHERKRAVQQLGLVPGHAPSLPGLAQGGTHLRGVGVALGGLLACGLGDHRRQFPLGIDPAQLAQVELARGDPAQH